MNIINFDFALVFNVTAFMIGSLYGIFSALSTDSEIRGRLGIKVDGHCFRHWRHHHRGGFGLWKSAPEVGWGMALKLIATLGFDLPKASNPFGKTEASYFTGVGGDA